MKDTTQRVEAPGPAADVVAVDRPDGVVTFLFTDIEGSTERWQAQPEAMASALADHDEIARRVLSERGGYLFGIGGDGFFAAFGSPVAAFDAAQTILAELDDHDLINVRIGLHTAEATVHEDAFVGLEVNRTARITTCAHGGQLVLSSTAADLLGDRGLRRLGTYQLRGFQDSTVIYQHGDGDFPPLRAAGQRVGNLAEPRDRLIGRAQDLEAVQAALEENRLVTLVGLGGVGKTRLATEAALAARSAFGDGVWIAPMAPVAEGGRAAAAIVGSLGLHVAQGTVDEELLADWMEAKDALLIIDNCEHLAEPLADLVDRLLSVPTNARVLATSQTPLGLRGECVLHIEPLSAAGGEDGSAALFADRAGRVRPDFDAAPYAQDIGDICTRLDHLPLGIELAASLAGAMEPPEIARRLDERFRLLRTRDRHGEERHRTLAAALQWSFDLLEEAQQVVLRRLAVFAAPFTVDQAEAVLADDTLESWDVFDAVLALVDRSLVVAEPYEASTRYHLLESVKAFGRRELAEHGELADLRDRYLDVIADFVVTAGEGLLGVDSMAARDRIVDEWLHVQAVLQIAAEDLDTARFETLYAALGPIWNQHGRTADGAAWSRELLRRTDVDPVARSKALFPAIGAVSSNEAGAGEDLIVAAEELWREHGTEPPVVGFGVRALNTHVGGDDLGGCELAAETLRMCRDITDFTWNRNQAVVMALSVLSLAEQDLVVFREMFEYESNLAADDHLWRGMNVRASASRVVDQLDFDDPIGFVAETARLQMGAGYHHAAAHTFEALGVQHLKVGNTVEAAESVLQAIELSLSDGPGYLWVRLLHATAVLMGEVPDVAAQLVGFSQEFHRQRGDGRSEYQKAAEEFFDTVLVEACGDRYPALLAEGAEVSADEILELAMTALRSVIEG